MSAKAINKGGTVDLTQGPLFKKIISFTIPIILTGVLQLLFNAADIIVVGNFAGEIAVAAVSSTGSLINLIVNLLMGLSVGAGVCVARCYGSQDDDGMHKVVHTAMPTAAIGGVIFGVFGFFCAHIFLGWMGTPDNVIDLSSVYVRIYFIGVPFTAIYNFGAAILRSVGDTKRPLIFLIIAGVVNVLFNLMFVILFGMDVDGVAWATVISQVVSAVMVVWYLMRVKGSHSFQPKKMRFYGRWFKQIALVGLPAGIQGSLFSVSNVIIQSSINSFGDIVMSGNGAAANIEGFVYISMNSFHQTALSFTGQHIGAGKQKRIKNICLVCVGCVSVVGLVLGVGAFLLGRPLLSLYIPGELSAIEYGIQRLSVVSATYLLCGIMDVFSGMLRGMGHSISSTIITLICVCGLRIVWVYTYFAENRTQFSLYLSYPLSWIVCILAQATLFFISYYRMMKKLGRAQPSSEHAPEDAQTP